jgi:hypothetical protein
MNYRLRVVFAVILATLTGCQTEEDMQNVRMRITNSSKYQAIAVRGTNGGWWPIFPGDYVEFRAPAVQYFTLLAFSKLDDPTSFEWVLIERSRNSGDASIDLSLKKSITKVVSFDSRAKKSKSLGGPTIEEYFDIIAVDVDGIGLTKSMALQSGGAVESGGGIKNIAINVVKR